ncbi:MAG: hypothetical protein JW751_02310 [Polyangiaceae bacterium]|nr:hypothetical protein [Polyangiaceae bacterium]
MDLSVTPPPWWSRLAPLANVLAPGIYAWGATVAAPAFGGDGGLGSRLMALAALVALVAGAALALCHPPLGRGVGIAGFALLSLLTWVMVRDSLAVDRIDPVRGCLGGLGWMLTAIGWGGLRTEESAPEEQDMAVSPLEPRKRLAASTWLVLAIAFAGALGPLVMAWSVDRTEHALLAQTVAVLAAIGMATAGGLVAVDRLSIRVPVESGARLRHARLPLALLIFGLGGGLLWSLFT